MPAPGRTGGGTWAPAAWRRAGPGCRDCRCCRGEITPSQVLLVQGDVRAHDALLVLSAASTPQEQPRPDFCCGVAFWLERDVVVYGSGASPGRLVAWRVGTHEVRQVTTIRGYDPDREVVDSSYAAVWQ